MELAVAMGDRTSCRAFAPRPVERATMEEVLRRAGRAPSALNLQPWELTVVMGEELGHLVRRLLRARSERSVACTPGATRPLPDSFERRRRESFGPMVRVLQASGASVSEFVEEGSCRFYGAPAALILYLHRAFTRDRYLCLGAFLAYLLLAAHDLGLATCPIGLVTAYGEEIQEQLNIPEDKEVVLAVALGYRDETSPLAHLHTPREPLQSFVRWFV
jgi:nitroreductase